MNLTCTHCYAEQSIEAMIESEAGRDYARLLLSQPPALQRGLSAYVWMFRSAKRNLSYERRLKLAGEVLALGADPRALAAALSETVESLRRKRDEGKIEPLTGHRYLLKVIASVASLPPSSAPAGHLLPQGEGLQGSPLHEGEGGRRPGGGERSAPQRSKRAQGIAALQDWAND